MNPIFGLNYTDKNDIINNSFAFATKTVPLELRITDKEEKMAKANPYTLKEVLKFILILLENVLVALLSSVCIGIINAFSDGKTKVLFKNNVTFYCVIVAVLVVLIVSMVILLKIIKRNKPSDKVLDAQSNFYFKQSKIIRWFNLPSNAINVDLFQFRYKQKNGKQVLLAPWGFIPVVETLNSRLYVKEDKLYIVDLKNQYEFNLKDFGKIELINLKIAQPKKGCSKNFSLEQLKEYKLEGHINNGNWVYSSCYALTYNAFGLQFEIYFPIYELELVKQIVGIS